VSAAGQQGHVPPPVTVPDAPRSAAEIAALNPLTTTWPAGQPLFRCYDVNWGARDFYAGDEAHRGRFHPVTPAGADSPLPVLYCAEDVIGAVSETVFHDVPVRGVKQVPHAKLVHRLIVPLISVRDLTLIDLTSPGLSRLGLSRVELIDSDPRSYPGTAEWASALHDHPAKADGLLWVSRLHDRSACVVLFGDRVAPVDLAVQDGVAPLLLGVGAGLELVSAAADRAAITITGLPG
jgi:RES domain-containing protein